MNKKFFRENFRKNTLSYFLVREEKYGKIILTILFLPHLCPCSGFFLVPEWHPPWLGIFSVVFVQAAGGGGAETPRRTETRTARTGEHNGTAHGPHKERLGSPGTSGR